MKNKQQNECNCICKNKLPKRFFISKNRWFPQGLWSRSLEPEPKIFEWWSRTVVNRGSWHPNL